LARRILKLFGAALLLLVLFLALGLGWAHLAIRRERAPLPAPAELAAGFASEDRPIRLTWINTASQKMPRSAVLDASRDPNGSEPYTMSFPSFVLEWADGRILLVDAGMPRADAISFGPPAEWVAGADPIAVLGSVGEQLGEASARIGGIVFTHLHTDHVAGVKELCGGRAKPIAVPMTKQQAENSNYSTRPGRKIIDENGCLEVKPLEPAEIQPLPGFPGVALVAAGGHTPGTQLVVAEVGNGDAVRRYAFTGDIVNHIDGIRLDLGKPALYRWLVIPEDDERLGELRRLLAALERDHGFTLLVAHDQRSIEAAGVPPFQR
jgi:glyoxylase-like metal-dependent hydrolase (beta-lactamase superfamily II)